MVQITKNKKAYFDYEILETYTAGIVLFGSEVKSIRNKDISIKEAYCHVVDNEMWLNGSHIAQFKESGNHQNHEPVRNRKLLLNKKEINKLQEKVARKGLTIIPLKVIINGKGLIKVDIGLAVGKKDYDKRQTIKDNDIKRDMDRSMNQQ
jgi:SsrA-binding protein